jgi:carboxyl-terminal processing protease
MKKLFLLLLGCMILSPGNAQQQFDTTAYKSAYKAMFEKTAFDDSLTAETKIAGLSSAWAEAKFNFANFDLIPQTNWDSIYKAYIPKVLATQTKVEYYEVLGKFYKHLNDGHSLIVAPSELWNEMYATLPIRAKLIDNKVVIARLQSTEEKYALLQPRTVIHKINGQPVQQYANENIAPFVSSSTPHDLTAKLYSYFFTRGKLSEPVVLELETPDGKIFTHSFPRKKMEQLIPSAGGYNYQKLDENTSLLTINTFMLPEVIKLYDSIFQGPHPKNLIVDLRENGGGNGNNGFELIGYLTGEPFAMSKQIMRRYKPVQRAWGGDPDLLEIGDYTWKPHKKPVFTGKVVVLSGPDTYSAAEDFISSFKHIKRGTVIGQTTGGSTGQPLTFALPFGGLGVVCAKRDLLPDWTDFVGVGIAPDVEVKPGLEAYLSGRDEVMEAALKMLE